MAWGCCCATYILRLFFFSPCFPVYLLLSLPYRFRQSLYWQLSTYQCQTKNYAQQDFGKTVAEFERDAERYAAELLQQGYDSVCLASADSGGSQHYVCFSQLRCLAAYLCEFPM